MLLRSGDRNGRRALLFGFPARNAAIVTLVAVAAPGRPDFASFGVVFFLAQATLLVPLALSLASALARALDVWYLASRGPVVEQDPKGALAVQNYQGALFTALQDSRRFDLHQIRT